ncbi:MAG: type II toxin-antitoxin system RelE/ParE family toxin [Planctomycetota bacterium]
MHEIQFSDRALKDLTKAFEHYRSASPRIADRFELALAEAISCLSAWPDSGRLIEQLAIRKMRLSRFPFALLYEATLNTVNVLRVIDLRSDPKRWIE